VNGMIRWLRQITGTRRPRSRRLGSLVRVAVAVVALLGGSGWLPGSAPNAEAVDSLPNNFPHLNLEGFSATFSTEGLVDLTGEYFQAQGSNGRSCSTCHIAQEAWSINPIAIKLLFAVTGGTHPIFNPLDANNPNADLSTVAARKDAYSMMLTRGVFRRGGAPRAVREWDVVAVDDPHGFATADLIVQWRRVMPTINFHLGSATVNWDGGNSVTVGGVLDQLAGLENQARRNVTGGQQGPALPAFPAPLPPPFDVIIPDILGFETSLSTAQIFSFSAGFLNGGGARGGPEELSQMTKTQGRFDLFDAWQNSPLPTRRKIWRGQELFNATNANGRSCNGCHNSANNGTNINNTLFDIQTASAEVRDDNPDLPLYTFRNRTTGEERQLSDSGRGNVTGLWSDLGRFKTPTLRALAARAPYFHNGTAATLEEVVRHYERFLGFVFTNKQRDDLVAFLEAL
jgi:cytochrome c peroxidase